LMTVAVRLAIVTPTTHGTTITIIKCHHQVCDNKLSPEAIILTRSKQVFLKIWNFQFH
jgi:hypothetical protein